MNKFWRGEIYNMQRSCKYPLVVLQKKPTIDQILQREPSISFGLTPQDRTNRL